MARIEAMIGEKSLASTQIEPIEPSLEDVFVQLIGGRTKPEGA
jgi:hypothetical protein